MDDSERKKRLDYLVTLYKSADTNTVIAEALKLVEQYQSAAAYNILPYRVTFWKLRQGKRNI